MPARRPQKPNILFFGIDSLRRDHMSCYGYPRLTTPHLDRFAAESVLFEQTFSAHIPTTSAYASMLTGMDVFTTQVVALRHKGPLRPEVQTLPEILRAEGYNTSCVGFSGNPSSRGFDTYLDYPAWGSWNEGRSPKAEDLNAVALPELDRLAAKREPFLLFLRHMDPHAPYLPPAPFERMFYHGNELDRKNKSMQPVMAFKPFRDFFASWMPPGITDKDYVIAQYDGAIAYMDAAIQRIFTALAARGLAENTIVVVNGDHGETLYDHECYFDHHGLYEPTLTVPLIIRYPGRLPAGRRVRGYNQHKDLVPTLLELAGHRAQRHCVRRPQPPAHGARRGGVPRERVLHHRMHLDAQTWLAHPPVEAHFGPGAGFPFQAAGGALQSGRGSAREPQPGRQSARRWSPHSGSAWRPGSPSAKRPVDWPIRSMIRATGMARKASAPSRRRNRPTTRCISAIQPRRHGCRRSPETEAKWSSAS